MANVSSSNGLEKRPKLRFPGFDEPWRAAQLGDLLIELSDYATQESGFPLLTSSRQGLFVQEDYFTDKQANAETTVFSVLPYGCITYRHMSDDNIFHFNINRLVANGLVSKEYPVFTIRKDVLDTDFLVDTLNSSPLFSVFCIQQKKGGTRTRLYFKTLCSYQMFLPALHEQQVIASFIRLLDKRIARQMALVETLKKYKRGLLNQIFSAISKGSQLRKLRELVHVSGGKTPSMSNSLYWNGDIVWISSKDMKSSRISGSELKITNLALNELTLYHPGTLLLVARSGILKHSLPLAILEVDATINQDIKALQVHGCNAFYLYYAILSQEDNIIRTLVKTGTTVQSLMMDSFLNIEIPTPDIDLQQSIVDKLAKLEKYVDVQEKELSLLSQMRNGLLQQLFI